MEKEFREILNEETNERRKGITEIMVEKEIKKMKRKKTRDLLSWKAESIKDGVYKMVKIQSVLFNWIEEEDEVPKQFELTTKSVRKKGNQEKLRENQRGLFMGNVISKVYVSSIYKFTKVVAFCLKVA